MNDNTIKQAPLTSDNFVWHDNNTDFNKYAMPYTIQPQNQLIIDLDKDLDLNMINHLKQLIKREEDKIAERNKHRIFVQNDDNETIDITEYKRIDKMDEEDFIKNPNGYKLYYLKKCGVEIFKSFDLDPNINYQKQISDIESDQYFITWLIPPVYKDSEIIFSPYIPLQISPAIPHPAGTWYSAGSGVQSVLNGVNQ